MSRYRLGAAAERRVRDFLERHGFEVVRAAGSKGKWDLVAWKMVGRRLILLCLQVKSRSAAHLPSLPLQLATLRQRRFIKRSSLPIVVTT